MALSSDLLAEKIQAFLDSGQRSAWVKTPQIAVYLRRGVHIVCGEPYRLIDLANVTVAPQWRRSGVFIHCLDLLQELCPLDGVRCENVLSKILCDYLLRLQQRDVRWVRAGDHFSWIKGKPSV